MRTTREWKTKAKKALKDNYGLAIMGFYAVVILSALGGNLSSLLFPGVSALHILLQFAFVFIFSLIASILTAGSGYLFLNIARNRERSLGNLLFFFKNNPDRVIVVALVLSILEVLASLPCNLYAYLVPLGDTLAQQTRWYSTYLVLMCLSLVLQLLLSVPFSQAYYLLADDPQMTGKEALRKSMQMMKGNMGKYIWLHVTFLPWILMSVVTLYIALIWILPYLMMTKIMFYRDLAGELDEEEGLGKGGYELPPYVSGDLHQEEQQSPGDDYNAEA